MCPFGRCIVVRHANNLDEQENIERLCDQMLTHSDLQLDSGSCAHIQSDIILWWEVRIRPTMESLDHSGSSCSDIHRTVSRA